MAPTDATSLLNLINSGGVVGLLVGMLVLVLAGSYRGWWYTKAAYEDLRQERDSWRTIALSGTRAAERAAGVAEQQLGLPR